MAVVQQPGIGVHGAPVFPLGTLDPLHAVHVEIAVRVGDQPLAQQVGVHLAGHIRLVPRPCSDLAEGPSVVQRQDLGLGGNTAYPDGD